MNLHHFDIPLVTLLAFLLSACGSGDAEVVSHDKTTAIQLIDSLAIHETDDRFIGELVDADVELDPLRIYVADRKMRRVAVVTADGSIEQLIGSPGKGPGELGRPVFLSVEGERMVVAQQRWRGFSVFDASGTYIDNFRLPDGHWVGGYDLFQTADGYVLPTTSFNPRIQGTLEVPPAAHTIAMLTDTFTVEKQFGTFPSLYQDGEYILQRRTMDVRADSFAAVGLQLVPNVRLYDLGKSNNPLTKKLSVDPPKFRPPEEETPLQITTENQSALYERMASYVIVEGTFLLQDGVVMQVFADHSEGYYEQTEFEPSEQKYYATLGTLDSNERLHLSLPGRVLARDENDRIYIERNPTPEERTIGIYKVTWP